MRISRSVSWRDGIVQILDQTLLPNEEVVLQCCDIDSVFEAIRSLRVRGAPAIGIAAAYGMLAGLDSFVSLQKLRQRADLLKSARPTAVNLAWAVDKIMARAAQEPSADEIVVSVLEEEARAIHVADIEACKAIGEEGLRIVEQYPNLLTHCNAGALAVSELGTALAPIYLAHRRGINVHVFVDETRPLLQGARLTAYELGRAGVPNTLITDSMAAYVMSLGKVDGVIVGADRIAANGDVANKIGTLNLAVLCNYFDIPFYVACPLSTIDLGTETGDLIQIEERPAKEVSEIGRHKITTQPVEIFNPAFDVTPASLVTAIITNVGLIEGPCIEKLSQLATGE